MTERDRLIQSVLVFASDMVSKLLSKSEMGWHGWDEKNYHSVLSRKLREHVEKAETAEDYVDIANFAMMIWRFKKQDEEPKP